MKNKNKCQNNEEYMSGLEKSMHTTLVTNSCGGCCGCLLFLLLVFLIIPIMLIFI
jgi:hypothetical protein